MATVYLAVEHHPKRQVAIKVLDPNFGAALGPERFLREVDLASKLTHPHILPIFAAAEADGLLYYVMPYVEGESLRDRLDREKQLPLEDALQITREVADGLSYAHSHDVVHRDIKPENILLESGHAVVADFGIARAITAAGGTRLTETGLALGTPAYMSPEQSTGEMTIDGRSDLYSLGCVLYEMLAGEPPFTGPTAQAIFAKRLSKPLPRASVLRESVPASVEAALAKALARTPADRFATAQQFAAALPQPGQLEGGAPAVPRRRRVTRKALFGSLVVVALGVAGGVRLLSSSGIHFAPRDWIVVTELDNRTGDSVFEGSLSSALTVGLQQSRYVNVLPQARISQMLGQMERPDTTRLDEAVGREVALRANVRVLVVPAITRIDSTYVLTTRIVDPQTAADLLTRSRRAEGRGQVLSALDELLRQLRRDLGESRRAVARNGVRLDDATTPSLEALRAWTEGNGYWNTLRYSDAAERYRRALSLDSNFAMAHKMLGEFHSWRAQRDSSEVHFAKALSKLDRVTERERLVIQAAFHFARANWDAAIRAQETYVDRYPDDLNERYNLGTTYMRADRHEDAIRTLRQVVEIDSTVVDAYINLATTYSRMGTYAEALSYYRRAFALRPEYRLSSSLNHEFGNAYLRLGQLDSAEATFTLLLSGSAAVQAQGHRSLGLLRMYQGRYAEGRSHFEQAIARNRITRAPVSEFRNRLYLVAIDASTGRARDLRSDLRDAGTIADTVFLGPAWLYRLAAWYAGLDDTVALTRLLALIKERAAQGSTDDQGAVAGTEALFEMTRGQYAHAIELLERASLISSTARDECRPVLARAYRLSGDPERAASTYLEVVATKRALGWEPQEAWILAYYELGKLYQERGDTTKAVEFYRRFLDIWKDGDVDLTAFTDARNRLRALTGPG
jgi:serine/threonine-protein kinase